MKCLKRVRIRQGRCYELALRIMLYEPGAEKFALVHGRVRESKSGFSERVIEHAWIEINDRMIYDPVLDEYVPGDKYVAGRSAVVERRYTHSEAMEACSEARQYGPWHTGQKHTAGESR
jgi:hypothetical protein